MSQTFFYNIDFNILSVKSKKQRKHHKCAVLYEPKKGLE